jgi:hypothetical protein
VDLKKLSMPEKIISASAIVLFVASFLPWFKIDFLGGSVSGNGWDVGFFWGGIPALIALAMLAHIALSNFAENVNLPDLPWPRVHMIAGIVAGAIVVLKLLLGHSELGVDFDRGYGLFLAALGGIGLAAGGFLLYRESSGSGTTATSM